MATDVQPLTVTRVHTATGAHIEPAFDETWDDFTKLRWHAAVVAVDAGLPVEVHDKARRDGQGHTVPGWYSINVGSRSIAALDYRSTWDVITGVSIGAAAARRKHTESNRRQT